MSPGFSDVDVQETPSPPRSDALHATPVYLQAEAQPVKRHGPCFVFATTDLHGQHCTDPQLFSKRCRSWVSR